jgi:hypothetical protein
MTHLQKAWLAGARELELDIVIPYELKTEAFSITAQVLLRNFGGPQGILIVSDFGIIKPYREQVIKLGYGFSTLTEPDRAYPFNAEEKEAFIEMLSEWGWSGDPDEEPEWLEPREG